jgi:asparagine synthase (glutamine-hydrolysing)
MFRYMGLLWDIHSNAHTRAAQGLVDRLRESSEGWTSVLETAGLVVFAADMRPASTAFRLPRQAGVIVGTLFEKEAVTTDLPPQRLERLDESATSRLLESSGRTLISSYWGRYVAFLCDARQSRRWVICGPISSLPCYFTLLQGVAVVYSRVDDCVKLAGAQFTVNPQQLAIRVCTGLDRVNTSLLNEVSTVYPGECIEFKSEQRFSRSYYWHPREVATTDVVESLDEATQALRITTKGCVAAWAGCYESVLHLLSGGLDSAIVIACLGSAMPKSRITCLTLWSDKDGSSDERQYARLAAARAGCPLVEQERPENIDGREVLRFRPQATPVDLVLWSLETIPALRPLANRVGAEAIFSGSYGDGIFCSSKPELVGIDYVVRHGIRRDLLTLLLKISAYRSQTVWKLLSDAIWYGQFPRRWDPISHLLVPRKLTPLEVYQTVASDPQVLAPWFSSDHALPPSKFMHALDLVLPSLYYNPLGAPTDAEITDPLFSQPLVELCLRIPTYIHTYDGKRRSAIRRALKPDMPPEIVSRYWKGGASRHFKSLLMRNLPFFRELLLDGSLVRHRLLDRRKLEDALSGEPSKSTAHTTEVLDYVCIEAWLQHYSLSRLELPRALASS